MIGRLTAAVLLLVGLLLPLSTQAQQVRVCVPNTITPGAPPSCQDVTSTNPFSQRSGTYGTATAPQYCQITSLGSATKLVTANCATGTILATATIAQICVSTSAIRYTSSDVVTPTASVGIPVAAGACFQYSGPLSTFTAIQQASGAVLDIETFP